MGACTYLHVLVTDVFVAEALACERVIWFAGEMGFQHIEVEGDSLALIKKLNSSERDK